MQLALIADRWSAPPIGLPTGIACTSWSWSMTAHERLSLVDTSIFSIRIAQERDRLIDERGEPKIIVCHSSDGPTITGSTGTKSRQASRYRPSSSNSSPDACAG